MNQPDPAECANEPIRIPGAIQPHGFLVVCDQDLRAVQISANASEFLNGPVEVGATLVSVLGTEVDECARQIFSGGPESAIVQVRARSTLEVSLRKVGAFIAIEGERSGGVSSFAALRHASDRLNRSSDQAQFGEVVVEEMRSITGFDRVMIYKFDPEWNGAVISEAKRDDLESFMGLHYPASDIPAQARELYTQQWIRLISNVEYEPVAMIPPLLPDGAPLDMTDVSVRSVSPVHLQYLKNMGVRASMSVSLLHEGRLWGLIACHHYSGPRHLDPSERASAEMLGRTASLLLGVKAGSEAFEDEIYRRSVHAQLANRLQRRAGDMGDVLTSGQPSVRDLARAAGASVMLNGRRWASGNVLDEATESELVAWIRSRTRKSLVTDSLATLDERWTGIAPVVSGLVYEPVAETEGSYLLWTRPEVIHTIDWAGNPCHKVTEDHGRLGPRRSFERWAETVRYRSESWRPHELEVAGEMARHMSGVLALSSAESNELSEAFLKELVMGEVPSVKGARLSVAYLPGNGDRVGGDWYDAVHMPDDTLALCVGDVAGHGAMVAGVMAQLRAGLRALLMENELGPARAISRLNQMTEWLLPSDFATAVVGFYDPRTKQLRFTHAGHLPPVLVRNGKAELVQLDPTPALGIGEGFGYEDCPMQLEAGDKLVLYTDGLVERRGEDVDKGVERLREALDSGITTPADIADHMGRADDDITVFAIEVVG